ncbi:MAG: PPC domain-containing protein, partial [Gemmatimonadales bacterium]
PDSGATAVLSDGGGYTPGGVCGALGGGDGCRYYRVTIPAGRSYDVTLKWDPASTTDMGVYIADATGTAKASSQAADNAGPQAGGPETATFTLDPGTYTWAIVWFAYAGAAPPFFQLQVTAH